MYDDLFLLLVHLLTVSRYSLKKMEILGVSAASSSRLQMHDERLKETYNAAPLSSKRRRSVSKIWNDFDKVIIDGTDKAVCKHCNRKFVGSSKSGTTHLKNHLSRCPGTKDGETQKKMLSSHLEIGVGGNFVFDYERSRLDVARMITKHGYPLDLVDHEFFQIFVKNLQPKFKLYSQDTLKADILRVYKKEKEKLYKYLGMLSCHFSLIIQFLTSNDKKNVYCCLAIQFLEDGLIVKKILALKKVNQYNNIATETLFGTLTSLLQEWDIDNKLCSITLGSSNQYHKLVLPDLGIWLRNQACQLPIWGDIFQIHCAADILNLLFQDGLNEMAGMLLKMRNAIRYMNEAPVLWKLKFQDTLEKHNMQVQYSTIYEDVSTRWDSNFLILESFLKLRKVFSLVEGNDCDFMAVDASLEEWDMAAIVYKYLKILYDAICSFYGSKYLTANVYFPKICGIHLKLLELQRSEHAFISMIAEKMKVKFDQYFDKSRTFLAIAVILDPGRKFEYVQFVFEKFYGLKAAETHLVPIRSAFDNLLDSYEKKVGLPALSSSLNDHNGNSFTSNLDDSDCDMLNRSWCEKIRQRNKVDSKVELLRYLAAPLIDANEEFDILDWWNTNSLEFPILGKMALDILGIPMSTSALISSYSSFNTEVTRTIINPAFNGLQPDIIEALICGEDWLDMPTKKIPNKEDEQHSSRHTFGGEYTSHDHALTILIPSASSGSESDKEKSESLSCDKTRLVLQSLSPIWVPEVICSPNMHRSPLFPSTLSPFFPPHESPPS